MVLNRQRALWLNCGYAIAHRKEFLDKKLEAEAIRKNKEKEKLVKEQEKIKLANEKASIETNATS